MILMSGAFDDIFPKIPQKDLPQRRQVREGAQKKKLEMSL
jgi:hypothetical protein